MKREILPSKKSFGKDILKKGHDQFRLNFLKLQNKSIGGDNRLYFAVFDEWYCIWSFNGCSC